MRNRWLLNLGLVALVAVLALVAFSKRSKDENTAETPLTTLTADKIGRVRIQYPGEKAIVLEKNGQTWLLAAPLRARANQFKVENLLRLATAVSGMHVPVDNSNRGKYGLDKPKARVWLENEEIQVGVRHPFKNAQYVLYRDTVHLVPAYHFIPGSYRYANLISPRLLEENRTPVAFELPELSLRLDDGNWKLDPQNEHITPDRINEFVNAWRFAQALAVDRYSASKVHGQIRITFKDTKDESDILELGILSYKPEFVLYRKDEGLEYRFIEDTGKRLLNIKESSK